MKTFLITLISALPLLPAIADTLEIKPAVQLSFSTPPNRSYLIETSEDFAVWKSFSPALFPTQSNVVQYAASPDSKQFFRLTSSEVRNLNSLLEPIRAAQKLPGLACAVVLSNRIVGLGAVGLRKSTVNTVPVTIQDKWHHGSLTKSMTATLAAMLVEEGKITWNTALKDVFPNQSAKMNAAWRNATLEQLCSNRGGAPGDLSVGGIWTLLWNFAGPPREARRLLLEKLTALAPSSTPGTQYEYSNAGFSLAGHMLETVANKAWEDLLQERLFSPLGMTSAGFGVPATPRYIDQPWGHTFANGTATPIEPGTNADNPAGIGPAGTVHCSIIDLARYTLLHLQGHAADTALLKRSSFLKLHTAVPNNVSYAFGWSEVPRPWANGNALNHNGSNLQWFSVIWMAPNRGFGVIVSCNAASSTAPNPGAMGTDQVAAKMIGEFLK